MYKWFRDREKINSQWMVVERNPMDLREFRQIEPVRFVYSPTGESHGSGSDTYRWVSRLTKTERQLVHDGHIVVIDKFVSRRAPCPVQIITYHNGRYNHQVPDPDMRDDCLATAGYPAVAQEGGSHQAPFL